MKHKRTTPTSLASPKCLITPILAPHTRGNIAHGSFVHTQSDSASCESISQTPDPYKQKQSVSSNMTNKEKEKENSRLTKQPSRNKPKQGGIGLCRPLTSQGPKQLLGRRCLVSRVCKQIVEIAINLLPERVDLFGVKTACALAVQSSVVGAPGYVSDYHAEGVRYGSHDVVAHGVEIVVPSFDSLLFLSKERLTP